MSLELWQWIITLVAGAITLIIAIYSWNRLRAASWIMVGWFALSLTLSRVGFFTGEPSWVTGDLVRFMVFGTVMALPLVGFFATWTRLPRFRTFWENLTLGQLTAIQVYRVAGVIFFWMNANDLMPSQIGIFTGLADLTVGVTAIPLAWILARNSGWVKKFAIGWHIFGIADFLVAVSMVSLSIFGILNLDPAPTMIGVHPLALISLFQLPLSIAIHSLALRMLIDRK